MNLLVTGAWQDAKAHIAEIESLGHRVVFMQQEADALPCQPDWVEGVICNGLFLHHPLPQFPNLRYIQLTSAGFDRVDMDYVRAHGIEIHNAKGVYSVPMAEFAVVGVLSIYKKLPTFYRQQHQHLWQKHRDLRELSGKQVLIVGCGDVGRECAKRFKAFGCRVTGVNRTVRPLEWFDDVAPLSLLEEMLPTADVVIVSIALTDQTRGIVKASRLKKDAVLVNISRGDTVDLEGVRAAVLDAFSEEPLPEESPLWDNEKILLTPHNSFAGEGNGGRLWTMFGDNLRSIK